MVQVNVFNEVNRIASTGRRMWNMAVVLIYKNYEVKIVNYNSDMPYPMYKREIKAYQKALTSLVKAGASQEELAMYLQEKHYSGIIRPKYIGEDYGAKILNRMRNNFVETKSQAKAFFNHFQPRRGNSTIFSKTEEKWKPTTGHGCKDNIKRGLKLRYNIATKKRK